MSPPLPPTIFKAPLHGTPCASLPGTHSWLCSVSPPDTHPGALLCILPALGSASKKDSDRKAGPMALPVPAASAAPCSALGTRGMLSEQRLNVGDGEHTPRYRQATEETAGSSNPAAQELSLPSWQAPNYHVWDTLNHHFCSTTSNTQASGLRLHCEARNPLCHQHQLY